MKERDEQLIDALKKGNEKAFREIYCSFYKAVQYFISHYIADEEIVKDITQDSFVALWNSRNILDSSKGYRSFLLTVAKNKSLNYLRNQKYVLNYSSDIQRRTMELAYESLRDSSLDRLLQKDLISQIRHFIDHNLSEKNREVFILSRMQNLSNEKIAEKLNISVKTVEYHIMIVLRLLRKSYGDYLLFFLFAIWG